ncbi:MAG: tRNA 5-methoxyuridine(34)/uridine 5-oxyacetic acid(34) synthase CmoB [Pirellulaceae bacterium]|nr:tRNA 5-methoxyuridine(34)/uridine 5-oxyacetic acid(34) synthase CmoB [Pirellulaceae bacterium]
MHKYSTNPTQFLDRQPAVDYLLELDLPKLAQAVQRVCQQRFQDERDGHLRVWRRAWDELPSVASRLEIVNERVTITPQIEFQLTPHEAAALRGKLMKFHPWRKGPFDVLGIQIDSEWQSNLKWQRFAEHVDWRRKRVLDVGSGNGYYGWRMLQSGADWVMGCEPFLLSVVQFEVFRRFNSQPERHFVVPLADTDIPRGLGCFDISLSMGVLYHRPNPIQHLQILHSTLRPRGQLILETIVLADTDERVLVPEDRYAKMRNVWFIPSLPMLQKWLRRTGYGEIQVLDVSRTTENEQRATPWMHFESLANFLDPNDSSRTLEGYPAPCRAVLLAQRRG